MERPQRYSILLFLSLGIIAFVILSCGPTKKVITQLPLIPRETLLSNPEKVSPMLSPDGKYLAYFAEDAGVVNIWVKTVGEKDDRALTSDRGQGIAEYFWAPNSKQILYLRDRKGDENWRLYSIPVEGGFATCLTPFESIQARIIAVDSEFPNEILIGLNDRDRRFHDIYHLDLNTGKLKLEVENLLGVATWVADHRLQVRIALIPKSDGGGSLLHRKDAGDPWKTLIEWGIEDAQETGALGFSEDNKNLYMISSIGANTTELRAIDVETGEQKTLASDPLFDISELMIEQRPFKIQAVQFADDRSEWQILDEEVKPHLAALRKLHRGNVKVVSRSLDDRFWLVSFNVDDAPLTYFFYDVTAQTGGFLFSTQSALDNRPLAKMEHITLLARDSLELHCYLTLPLGIEAKNLPAVLKIHGGPWERDAWGYNPQVQWLADRGYAVMQVNFRGSSGYGKLFTAAGDREWGGKMQDDITDATNWLISNGIADSSRIVIFGESYGGFAVLSGLIKEPGLYACGVDLFGPANLTTWINTVPPTWEVLKPMFRKRIGDPDVDAIMLKERSPIYHLERIRAPLLIAQGASDVRVPKATSRQLFDELKTAGKSVEYCEYPDEGHGFARSKNRLNFFAKAEKFLSDHLGGRYEPEAPSQ